MISENPEEEKQEGGPLWSWEGAKTKGQDFLGALSAAESTAEFQASKSIWDPFVTRSLLQWFMTSLEPPWWNYNFIIHS